MKLEEIGFYSLSDERARTADHTTPLQRCELLLTNRCNFQCPYCRRRGGPDLTFVAARDTVLRWARQGLRNIRFSGGEPTLWPNLARLVGFSRGYGVKNVAISTNGSADWEVYEELIEEGVTDFSVSLDACCASTAEVMAGTQDVFHKVTRNIAQMAEEVYTTIGVVITPANLQEVPRIVDLAIKLVVHDVRLITAAQWNKPLTIEVDPVALERFPILRYRLRNLAQGRQVRGLRPGDCQSCPLVLDDMAVMGDAEGQLWHYPCIIFLREGGDPIGKFGENVREERLEWFGEHKPHTDTICLANCLDVCCDHNNKWNEFHAGVAQWQSPVRDR